MNISRRECLRLLSMGSAGTLAGCCIPSPHINQSNVMPATNFLDSQNLFATSEEFTPCIDPHGHFFNATDLQAGGYIAGPVASDEKLNPKLYQALRIVGLVIDGAVRALGRSASKENRYLDELEVRLNALDFTQSAQLIEDDIAIENERIAEELYKRIRREDENNVFEEIISGDPFLQSMDTAFNEEFLRRLFNDEQSIYGAALAANQLETTRLTLGYLVFVKHMLSYRTHNIHAYRQAYYEHADNIKVVRAGNALVDFDHWLGECDEPYSRLVDQIYLYDRLAKIHGGYIFNLISFNPWNGIEHGNRYYDLVEYALSLDTFRGAKLYPTIGYYPYGNSVIDEPKRTTPHPPNMRDVDDALGHLYEICGSEIPVMAHGNHSKGTMPEYKVMAGPRGWKKALDAYPELRVNIGHFGGNSVVAGSNWTDNFIKMMSTYEGLHTDLGYWDELQSDPDFARAFVLRLEAAIGDGSHAYDRVMFGTDWLMTSKEDKWQHYPNDIYTNLKNGNASTALLDAIFYDNARRLFKL